MINEPTITATCDLCGRQSDEMDLCALAGGGWDERYIKRKLQKLGWTVDGDKTYCENHAAELEKEEDDETDD